MRSTFVTRAAQHGPMLASLYLKEKDQLAFPAYVSPKLDGIRCLANSKGLWTRSGRRLDMPHVADAIKRLALEDKHLHLDGELYVASTEHHFSEVLSMYRTKSKTNREMLQKLKEKVTYNVFDCLSMSGQHGNVVPGETPFAARYKALRSLFTAINRDRIEAYKPLRLVKHEMVASHEAVRAAIQGLVAKGNEGAVVREASGVYVDGRTKQMLKLVPYFEKEFAVMRMVEGTGYLKGAAAKLELMDDRGELFYSAMAADRSAKEKLWHQRNRSVGMYATVRFPRLSRNGLPLFPQVKGIRGKKGWIL